MICNYFGICGSCTLYNMSYQEQLYHKIEKIKESFEIENLDILTSEDSHFRNRSEFKIYHDDNKITYAMSRLDKKGVIRISSCSIVSPIIDKFMPILIQEIEPIRELEHKLFAIEFLSSTTNNLLITLIYHKKIDQEWEEEAKKLSQKLGIEIIGRSRKIKKVINKEYIDETLKINQEDYYYRLYDTGFTQPNAKVNQKMIGWVKNKIEKNSRDLLELYCGHGNFTIPLSKQFRSVLATEISKKSIKTAKENCELNSVKNIDFIRLSSEELTSALKKEREFNRLKDIDLDKFDFSHVFVDPPRAGLDKKTLNFITQFENIIYISCNPQTLKRDLEILKSEFDIQNFAVFDQFAYTEHLECGVILKKKG